MLRLKYPTLFETKDKSKYYKTENYISTFIFKENAIGDKIKSNPSFCEKEVGMK